MPHEPTMSALAILPFKPEFEAVLRSMERACQGCSKADTGGHERAKQRLANVRCQTIGQREGATFDIVNGLLDAIRSCDFCIADITGNNVNVIYELGFATALEKPIILLTQDLETLGFDLRGMSAILYDRDNLDRSLEDRLISAVKEIAMHLTDGPSLSLHAKSLALSCASATYFLDSEYRIHYMNESAADLFATTRFGAKSWIDSNLRDFINDISTQLGNLPAIEKNLQVQTEEIHHLEAIGRPSDIPSYNIERVILNSPEYGKLELQKTGVAVRDPLTGRVTGWVVSFNVVRAHEPDKFVLFHVKHRNQIQALLHRKEHSPKAPGDAVGGPVQESPLWPADAGVDRWIRSGCASPRLEIAGSYSEKQACFEFCASVMRKDSRRYGLESVAFLDDWFFDFRNAEYVVMRSPDDDLVGVFRLHTNHDVMRYDGIAEWVIETAEDNSRFADVGAYLHPAIDGPIRATCLAKLLGRAARIAERHQQIYLYCQVPSHLEKVFNAFLFERAGLSFKCPGWSQPSWTPLAVKCIAYSDDGDRPASGPVAVNRQFIDAASEEYHRERDTEVIV